MKTETIEIREAKGHEFFEIGQLMVNVYAQLEGFPSPSEQPKYYEMLASIGALTERPKTKLLVAEVDGRIAGAVIYFGDMQYYGSGGTATSERKTAGFRLLAVNPDFRGLGLGRLLTQKCIDQAKSDGLRQLIIHSTESMKIAWRMYVGIGFKRSVDLDFMQGDLPVFGFRLDLRNHI